MPAVSTRSGFGSSHSISGLIAVEPQSARNRPGTDERSIPRDESDRLPDQAGFARRFTSPGSRRTILVPDCGHRSLLRSGH
jgi:hypothetical protein